ncbi:unnamed protein product [Lampetra fluviatilis]
MPTRKRPLPPRRGGGGPGDDCAEAARGADETGRVAGDLGAATTGGGRGSSVLIGHGAGDPTRRHDGRDGARRAEGGRVAVGQRRAAGLKSAVVSALSTIPTLGVDSEKTRVGDRRRHRRKTTAPPTPHPPPCNGCSSLMDAKAK